MTEETKSYEFRTGLRSRPASLAIDAGTLRAREESKPDKVWSLSDITQINLRYGPTRFCRNRFRMNLNHSSGEKLTVSNVSFKGFAEFDDQSDTYRPFVQSLHRALLANGSETRFHGGLSSLSYWLHWLLTLFVGLALVVVGWAFVAIGLSWLILVKIALIIFYLPTLLAFMRRGKPSTYDPAQIPDRLLPNPASSQQ